MRLIIVSHGETDATLTGRCTGTTDVGLTADSQRQATSLQALLHRVLHGQRAVAFSVIEDHHDERCVGLWNADAVMLPSAVDQAAPPDASRADQLVTAGGRPR